MISPKIISKNKDFLIINKPAGLLVHPVKSRFAGILPKAKLFNRVNQPVLNREDLHPEEKTLVDWILEKFPKIKNVGDDPENRPGIVHRLDRETSGAMIIPLNKKTFEFFKKIFQKHGVRKTYLALVYGTVRSDRVVINKPIGIKSGTTRRSVHSAKMSKDAITELEVVKRFELNGQKLTLLRAYPKTGRTHQIRVHLASIHCPIVGDKLYGRKNDVFPELGRQFLHAEEIEFKDMNGKELKFKASLPKDLRDLLGQAGIAL